jgi:ribosome-associated protein
MSRAISITSTVRVPDSAIQVRAVRASGPGGQNVNKVATRIDLRVNPEAIEGLSDPRARLAARVRHRLDAEGAAGGAEAPRVRSAATRGP